MESGVPEHKLQFASSRWMSPLGIPSVLRGYAAGMCGMASAFPEDVSFLFPRLRRLLPTKVAFIRFPRRQRSNRLDWTPGPSIDARSTKANRVAENFANLKGSFRPPVSVICDLAPVRRNNNVEFCENSTVCFHTPVSVLGGWQPKIWADRNKTVEFCENSTVCFHAPVSVLAAGNRRFGPIRNKTVEFCENSTVCFHAPALKARTGLQREQPSVHRARLRESACLFIRMKRSWPDSL